MLSWYAPECDVLIVIAILIVPVCLICINTGHDFSWVVSILMYLIAVHYLQYFDYIRGFSVTVTTYYKVTSL
jgi:hypothetical protein